MNLPHVIYSGAWSGGHCQGIAVDVQKGYVYYSFTTMFVKTDLQGRLVGSVTGLLGHLGCIALCKQDGRVYGSLEYKQDAIGKGILSHVGSSAALETAFYIAIFDVDKITRPGMDAAADGVMTSVYLKEVVDDHTAAVPTVAGPLLHRYGCSGIDGTTFAPIPGSADKKQYLFVAYGVYGDTARTDNDHQVLLAYDTAAWQQYEQPLFQAAMHHSGPAAPDHKFFAFTGNTTYGVQNLEYDPVTGDLYMAVYRGKKPGFANNDMYLIDGACPPVQGVLQGVQPVTQGQLLTVKPQSFAFPYGATGMASLGDGRWYFSQDGKLPTGEYDTHVRLYRYDGEHPFALQEE